MVILDINDTKVIQLELVLQGLKVRREIKVPLVPQVLHKILLLLFLHLHLVLLIQVIYGGILMMVICMYIIMTEILHNG